MFGSYELKNKIPTLWNRLEIEQMNIQHEFFYPRHCVIFSQALFDVYWWSKMLMALNKTDAVISFGHANIFIQVCIMWIIAMRVIGIARNGDDIPEWPSKLHEKCTNASIFVPIRSRWNQLDKNSWKRLI